MGLFLVYVDWVLCLLREVFRWYVVVIGFELTVGFVVDVWVYCDRLFSMLVCLRLISVCCYLLYFRIYLWYFIFCCLMRYCFVLGAGLFRGLNPKLFGCCGKGIVALLFDYVVCVENCVWDFVS